MRLSAILSVVAIMATNTPLFAMLTGNEENLAALFRCDDYYVVATNSYTLTNSASLVNNDGVGAKGFITNNTRNVVVPYKPSYHGHSVGSFSYLDSVMAITNLKEVVGADPFQARDWSVVGYVRDVDMTSIYAHVLARAVPDDGSYGLVANKSLFAWQLHIEKKSNTLRFFTKDINNANVALSSAKLDISNGAWYQFAIVARHVENDANTVWIYWTRCTEDAEITSTDSAVIKINSVRKLSPAPILCFGAGKAGNNGGAEGKLMGYLDEVSYWTKELTVEELQEQARAFAKYDIDTVSYLHWKMDDAANSSTVADATPYGHDGTVYGGACGGFRSSIAAAGQKASSFGGFNNTSSYVAFEGLFNDVPIVSANTTVCWRDHTLILWARNPRRDGIALLARTAKNNFGKNSDVPWQLYVQENGALVLQAQDYYANFAVRQTEPLEWEVNVWYQIVLHKISNNSASSATFKLYRTKAGEKTIGEPLINENFNTGVDKTGAEHSVAGLANGATLVIGGGAAGYYPTYAPGGYWDGNIDDVVFSMSETLPDSYINENLKLYRFTGFILSVR